MMVKGLIPWLHPCAPHDMMKDHVDPVKDVSGKDARAICSSLWLSGR